VLHSAAWAFNELAFFWFAYLGPAGDSRNSGCLEMLGKGKMPAAVVGEVADDLNLDLVVLPMEAVHHKHIDCNLLAEFVPCPVMLLPL